MRFLSKLLSYFRYAWGFSQGSKLIKACQNAEPGTFLDVSLEIAPKRGNAVFFSYDKAHPSTKSLHGGAPMIAGEKWIAAKWLWEREFV